MKLCIIVLLFCFLAIVSYAQNISPDSLQLLQSEQKLLTKSQQKIESIQSTFYQCTDSLKKVYKSKFTTMDSVQQSLRNKLDSFTSFELSSDKLLSGNKMDSTQADFRNRIDSLRSLDNASTKIKHSIDSINHLQQKTISELNDKLQSLKEKTVNKLNKLKLPSKLSDRASDVTQKVNAFQIPVKEINIPSLNIGSTHDIPSLNNLTIPPGGQGLGLDKVSNLKNIAGLPGMPDTRGNLADYGKGIQQISSGNLEEMKELSKMAVTKAEELSGLNEIKDQTQSLDKYKNMSGKMQNPDSIKQFAVQEVKQVAVNHFAGKEQQLQEAMEKIAKYKSKYSSLNSLSEITRKRPNEMKGKPIIERLVPGIAIQVQKKGEEFMVDFNPYVGYRLTGRITSGLGWNQRVAYTPNHRTFNADSKIYGPRTFAEYQLSKGFSPRVEMEIMNTKVLPLTHTQSVDPPGREWVFGAFVGIKKRYKFVKNVKGTALVMVRLFNPEHKSPYADVLNVRFGFEFPMKRKAKA